MSKFEKQSIAVVAALLMSVGCWQFSFARTTDVAAVSPVATVVSAHAK